MLDITLLLQDSRWYNNTGGFTLYVRSHRSVIDKEPHRDKPKFFWGILRPRIDKKFAASIRYPTHNNARIPNAKMKRKLDANDEPAAAQEAAAAKPQEQKSSFADFGLDPRLVQAIAHEKYREPTLVQSKAIPLALEGKDVLAKAKTGSGKTAAYLLPVLQSILKRKQVGAPKNPHVPKPYPLTLCSSQHPVHSHRP